MLIIAIIIVLLLICFYGAMILSIIQVVISKEEIEATIIKINKKNIDTYDDRIRLYFPFFEYYVDGERYEKESVSGYKKIEFKIGEKIKVRYPKNSPQDAFIAKDAKSKIVTDIGIIVVVSILIVLGYLQYIARI